MLHNKTIIVTRRAEQAGELISLIAEQRGRVLLFPTIATAETEHTAERDKVLHALNHYHWIVFSSENAVNYFFEALKKQAITPAFNNIAAVGAKTAQTLRKRGVTPDLLPKAYTAKGLLAEFSKLDIRNKRILLPVSHIARSELPGGLKALGAVVDVVEFYRTVPDPEFKREDFLTVIQKNAADVLTFFSPSAFHYLLQLAGEETVGLIRQSRVAVAAVGPTTAAAIKAKGLTVEIMPEVSDSEHLFWAIVRYFNRSV